MSIRPIEELISVDNPAWPEIESLLASSTDGEALPGDPESCRQVLLALQVTTRSFLGAMALNCGGIVADHRWFRLLGGVGSPVPDLAAANSLATLHIDSGPPPSRVVGFDALGGRFAIDGGGLGVNPGEVCYFGPDSLEWTGVGGGHTAFVTAVLAGDLTDAFASLRWPGWEAEIDSLPLDHGMSLYPPPFSLEGKDLAKVSRRPVPMKDLLAFYDATARQLLLPDA